MWHHNMTTSTCQLARIAARAGWKHNAPLIEDRGGIEWNANYRRLALWELAADTIAIVSKTL